MKTHNAIAQNIPVQVSHRVQDAKVELGTLAADGRLMAESRGKESMLNFAFAAKGKERYVRSEDMATVVKDADTTFEFTEAAAACQIIIGPPHLQCQIRHSVTSAANLS